MLSNASTILIFLHIYVISGFIDIIYTWLSRLETMNLVHRRPFQVFEIKNDAKMKRTMLRPLPSGRISPVHAAMWATSVGVAETTLLACKVRLCHLPVLALHFVLSVYVH